MQLVLAVFLMMGGLSYESALAANVAEIVGQVSAESYTNYLVNDLYTHDGDERCFGPQHDLAQQRIRELFESFGLETSLHPFEYQETTYYNVVGVHRGITCPTEIYVLGAHYDSVEGSPGAMDNGSGVAGLLESARVLSQHAFQSTIVFVAFDREEQGYRGSRAYASNHIGDHIHGMLNLDCIAPLACGPEDPDYNKIRLTWSFFFSQLGEPTRLLDDVTTAVESHTELTCAANPDHAFFSGSDYVSFAEVGFEAVQFEPYDCQENPLLGIHTPLDSVDQPDWIDYDHGTRVTQAVVACLATLAMRGPARAGNPVPADGTVDVLHDTILTWDPGDFAETHDVYFGTNLDDVRDADLANPLGVLASQGQNDAAYDPDGLLQFGQTYYWRVDEVNGAPDNTIFTGEVWFFTVEPFAYPVENIIATSNATSNAGLEPSRTIDGSGLNSSDQHSTVAEAMWLGVPKGLTVPRAVSPCLAHIFMSAMDRPKPRSAQQARHKRIRFAYGAASAPLRPAS